MVEEASTRSPGQHVIGTRGPGTYLVALEKPVTHATLGVVVIDGRAQPALPVQSILARGYWEEWTGTTEEEQTILDAVPAHPIATAARPST